MSEEIWDEKLARVELMASGDETWDLSENDIAAIAAVLKDRAYMESSWSTATREKHELMAALSEMTENRDQLREAFAHANNSACKSQQQVTQQAATIERLNDLALQVRNYAAGESPDVEEEKATVVFGMIVDLVDAALASIPKEKP